MKTTDTKLLKQFYSVLNRKDLTENIFDYLISRWGLDGVDLEIEQEKILQKRSNLSKSQRDAIPEFINLRHILDERQKEAQAEISMNNSDENVSIAEDQITL